MDKNNLSDEEISNSFNFINYFNSIFCILVDNSKIPANITKLAEARETARKNNDWEESDRLRDIINAKGWNIRDGNSGQKIFPK
jgi:cysteinyl-tRNA synthetase